LEANPKTSQTGKTSANNSNPPQAIVTNEKAKTKPEVPQNQKAESESQKQIQTAKQGLQNPRPANSMGQAVNLTA
jgi:hypothetical protein